ncbi:hypothetical protein Belba_1165 [Belliella baltica DSM 15883]|uniref:Uncharacterized protein n=1 Tax=Belliella baltica (strain DSM 15883 / CIP 108006 / LMG 21964 / BA134) TaxID=866536 RepID=I3Z3I2_BELBD|nr:hypothetical protein [Belliella baltica]AFL83800.1 hypothetical protein Belba_1165 [Belliella baltica DSM 15883]
MIRKTIWIVFVATLMACQTETLDKEDFDPPYFQLEQFIEEQALILEGKSLQKEIQIKDTVEKLEVTPNQEEWLRELDFFIQADINRPALAQAYKISKDDSGTTYDLKKGEKSKLKSLKILFGENQEVQRIEFVIGSENTFYESETRGWLSIDEATGIIDAFEIDGKQKVVFLDPILMHVKAKVME